MALTAANAVVWANSKIGPNNYAFGGDGPTQFDCSGLTHQAYLMGASVDIGRTTGAQWNYVGSGDATASTIWDAAAVGDATKTPPESTLIPGDLIFWGTPGGSGMNNHVQMYVGTKQIVEALNPASGVHLGPLDFTGATIGYRGLLVGVKRIFGAASSATTAADTAAALAAPNWNQNQLIDATRINLGTQAEDLPDPRSNLPFAPEFLNTPIFQAGSDAPLIRGGIFEMPPKGVMRPRGQFACYFMMNPGTPDAPVTQSYQFDMSQPLQQAVAADLRAIESYLLQNQTWDFTLYFNRMYEVWNSGTSTTTGGYDIGPSTIGVRWDIRALERLMGLFDEKNTGVVAGTDSAGNPTQSSGGNSLYGSGGGYAPIGIPVEVVLGGLGSFRFQGVLTAVSVQFTRFSRNMIPVEAIVSISMVRLWTPPQGLDVVNPWVSAYGISGSVVPVPPIPYSGPRLGLKAY